MIGHCDRTRCHELRHPLWVGVTATGDEQVACSFAARHRGRDETRTDGDALLAPREIGLGAVCTGGPSGAFRSLCTLRPLQALRSLQALNALMTLGALWSRIAFGAALAGWSRWADAGGPSGPG